MSKINNFKALKNNGIYSIPLDAILSEICTFNVVFNCTVWTELMSLQD